jgi:peptidoglycan L-alanyl-D-glutamate endopeptidase CwlK
MINSRDIHELRPEVQTLAYKFIDKCKAAGIDVLITSTYRDFESQNELYAQGRTKPGKKVTNAKAGQSLHNFKVAIDFLPIVNGKANWNDLNLFKKCGEIAESLGFEWAGRWTTMKEYAHIQYTGGKKLSDFQREMKV